MKGSPKAVRRSLLLGTIGLTVLSVFLAAAAAAPVVAFFYFV